MSGGRGIRGGEAGSPEVASGVAPSFLLGHPWTQACQGQGVEGGRTQQPSQVQGGAAAQLGYQHLGMICNRPGQGCRRQDGSQVSAHAHT